MRIKGRSIPEIIQNLDETGVRILEAARREFAANGYHSANTDTIAGNADIGKGTLYRRFGNKQILFFCLLEWAFSSFLKSLETLPVEGSAVERFEQYIRHSRTFMTENIDIIRLYAHEQSRIIEGCTSDELRMWGINFHKRVFGFWQQLAREAAGEGALTTEEDPEVIGAILGGMAHAIYSDMIISESRYSEEEYRRREDVFLHILKTGLFTRA